MVATRRLAAILAADVAGYSRLMGADEEGTHERLKALRHELLDPKIAEHHGRIVKTTGDGLLVEFASVVDAVRCAVAMQPGMPGRNTSVGPDDRIELRIGINLGDVIVEGDDLYGEGVNILARVEALADAGGVFVSNTVHDHVRDRLPFVFEDLGDQTLKNISRPVRVYRVSNTLTHPDPAGQARGLAAHDAPGSPLSRIAGEGAERQGRKAGEGSPPPLPLPDKPSIAVLPFTNMSGDPEQEYFVDGMVEEIITALSRIRWLFVIARNSSFTYKGQAVDVKQVGRELGVRYVLEGSVRKAGGRVRITAQLIDAATGTHLWADRFDGSLEDVFDLQDKVATSVAGVIEPVPRAAEMRRSAARPTTDLSAYDLYLRAVASFSSGSKAGVTRALDLVEQAIDRDPHYGSALAYGAVCCHFIDLNGWTENPGQNRRAAIDRAERALESAGDDPGTLVYAAHALAYFGENIDAVIALVDRALALNPSFARGWLLSAQIRIWAGQLDLAIAHVGTAIRLSPRDLPGPQSFVVGLAHFLGGRFEDAMPKLIAAVQHRPSAPQPHRVLASCYAHMGRLEEARAIIERLRTICPVVVPELNHFRNPKHRELILSGLRLAAGEAA
jgi:TolB-like protein/class 3 adenylate cyclase/tetratricopeptide (TPR) repeat protein